MSASAASLPPLLLVLTGPTGSGKSDLALELARARRQLPVEIVSVDSVQVYRGMDIGSAKPSAEVRARVPHHLLDIRDPAESYSAGEFVRDARSAIAAILQRGRLPLLVGGTMLYLRALQQGLAQMPAASEACGGRSMRRRRAPAGPRCMPSSSGWMRQAAARIARTDAQRIQRALEVHRLTGVPISQWQRSTHGARERIPLVTLCAAADIGRRTGAGSWARASLRCSRLDWSRRCVPCMRAVI